jgi:ABC-type nitrate/sulfonate/bicarbonate transport system permease component
VSKIAAVSQRARLPCPERSQIAFSHVTLALGGKTILENFKIALPSASPDILAGMRLSLTVALILSVACEILAGLDGLGQWVLLSARAFRSADLFAGVILLGIIGYLTALAMSVVEKRLLRWRSSGR